MACFSLVITKFLILCGFDLVYSCLLLEDHAIFAYTSPSNFHGTPVSTPGIGYQILGLTFSLRKLWFTHFTREGNIFLIIWSHTLLHSVFLNSCLPSLMSCILSLQSKQGALSGFCRNIFSSAHLRSSPLHLPGCGISYSLLTAGYMSK